MPPGVYDKDGFKLGPNGGIFADPTANLTDNKDYESWDWKQIRAAVVGYSAAPAGAVPTSTPSFADPDSIRNASVVFNRARWALQHVSDNIRLQTEALAGENGAWKSPAADAFRSINLLFSAKLEAKAQQINGGEYVGTNNVPAQLWNSGNHLEWAQEAIKAVDVYYADYVRSIGVTMGNGLARISDYPELVAQMTEDMKKIVRILAQQYVMNTNSVTAPNPADFNVTPQPPGSDGNQPPPPPKIPPPPTGGAGGGNIPPPPSLNVPPPPGTGGGPSGGLGGAGGGNIPPPPSLNVPPPPGTGSGGPGGTGNVPKPPSLNVPPPPTGGAGNGGTGNIPKPPPLSVPPPSGTGGGTGGTGGGTGGIKVPPALAVNPPPSGSDGGTGNNVNVPRPPALGIEGPSGSNALNDRGGAVPPPPMMPPPAGAGGGGPGAGADRPDSSGLLGGVKEPWEAGSPPPLGDPGGVKPPLTKPEDWAAPPSTGTGGGNGAQVPPGAPMMPPPSGMGGQPGGSAAERPDSSGLLGGETKPWEGAKPPSLDLSQVPPPVVAPEDWATGDSGSSGVQVPGGEGLQLPGLPPAVDLTTPPGQQVPPGAPMMPPPPGAGGQPGGTAERPDSSGLLGGVNAPWTGSGDDGRVGGTSDMSESATSESWALMPADQTPVVPPPVVPPGAGTPAAVAERPDSSALLGGETGSWESAPPSGTDQVTMTPAARSAPWAVTPETLAEVNPELVVPDAETPEFVVAPEKLTLEAVMPGSVDLAPAAAPAGWAASSDVVPAVQDGPSAAATAAVLGASGVTAAAALAPMLTNVPPTGATPPGTMPNGTSNGLSANGTGSTTLPTSEFPHVDADGNVQDDEDEAGGLVLRGGAPGPLPGVDSVVVVRPDDAVLDTSAWDTGGTGLLLAGVTTPFVMDRSDKSDKSGWDAEGPTVDAQLEETPLWDVEPSIALATYRRRKAGEEGPKVVDSFVPDRSCGDEFSVPVDQREAWLAAEAERIERIERGEDEDEDAEPQERSAADLLNERESAWGRVKVAKPTGVLE
ncbi:hypothetical protein SAMN04488564_1249 [Lentzea waywayandensis]|uniref:Uncharacterized protein n=1 Tax=Lentzea waywayandensis TaxID=84724 RepID=A0A1I6FJ03_9PSEU|nr:hypothetical protein [Lentzea waywayandensis]SFR29916.1 hypothetical protein SAMN04488564_1249 [Lentzea waywayandensis]